MAREMMETTKTSPKRIEWERRITRSEGIVAGVRGSLRSAVSVK